MSVFQQWAAPLPLSPPTSSSQLISGLASTGDIDHERMRFRGHAFAMISTACPLSGRNSTYRLVQILEAGSNYTSLGGQLTVFALP